MSTKKDNIMQGLRKQSLCSAIDSLRQNFIDIETTSESNEEDSDVYFDA